MNSLKKRRLWSKIGPTVKLFGQYSTRNRTSFFYKTQGHDAFWKYTTKKSHNARQIPTRKLPQVSLLRIRTTNLNYFRNIFFSHFERYRVTVPLVGKGCRRLVDIMYSWNFKNRLVLDEAYKPLPVNRHVKAITILDSEWKFPS